MFPDIEGKLVCVDVETTGLNCRIDDVFGVALSYDDLDFYWDVRRSDGVFAWLNEALPKVKMLVNHNLKFDAKMLRKHGVAVPLERCRCTMLRAAIINEHLKDYSLDGLGRKYLKTRKTDAGLYEKLAELFGGEAKRKVQAANFSRAPWELMAEYAKGDTRLALRLFLWQEQEIERQVANDINQNAASTLADCLELEYRLWPHIVKLEEQGIRVDVDEAERARKALDRALFEKHERLNEVAGFEVNYNPGSHSIKKLFAPEFKDGRWFACDGTPLGSTDTGNASFNKENLERIRHEGAGLILECRKLSRAANTFLGGHILSHAEAGVVYPNINQTKTDFGNSTQGTITGRLSMSSPAMQQIPARDVEIAQVVRPVFLPDPGQQWAYGDLDQHEIRVFQHYVNDKRTVDAYQENADLDMHQWVADLTGLPRKATRTGEPNAKQLNIAVVFGMGRGTAAQFMGFPYTVEKVTFRGEDREREILRAGPEAELILDRFYDGMPGVKQMYDKAQSCARTRGYVRTIMGRHIRFPNRQFAYKAASLIYQGGSGDCNKRYLLACFEACEGRQSRVLLNIHDEYSLSIAPGEEFILQEIKDNIQRIAREEVGLRIPIRIDFHQPRGNWWEATKAPKYTK